MAESTENIQDLNGVTVHPNHHCSIPVRMTQAAAGFKQRLLYSPHMADHS
jgi:hypothetical protein